MLFRPAKSRLRSYRLKEVSEAKSKKVWSRYVLLTNITIFPKTLNLKSIWFAVNRLSRQSPKFQKVFIIHSYCICSRLIQLEVNATCSQSHTEILPVKVSVEDVTREIRFFILSDTNWQRGFCPALLNMNKSTDYGFPVSVSQLACW